MDPSVSTNNHPTRESLSQLPETSIHRQAYDLAKLIETIPQDPSLNSKPRGIVVGSFPLQSEQANDLDFEVQGVTWKNLQKFFADKTGQAGITSVELTTGGEDGIIIPKQPGHLGNAYVAVWLTLEGGRKVNLSIPLKVTSETSRYDLNSVERCPDLSFEEAVLRRNFAHRALGFDPLVGQHGEILDPLEVSGVVRDKTFQLVNPDAYKRDPLNLYQAIIEIATIEATPDSKTLELLRNMAEIPLSDDPSIVQPGRIASERSKFLIGPAKPSECLKLAIDYGLAERDFRDLYQVYKATNGANSTKDWEQALKNVDAAWATAKSQKNWEPEDILLAVATNLVHELSEVAGKHQFEVDWKNFIRPFLSADSAEATAALTEIESRLKMM